MEFIEVEKGFRSIDLDKVESVEKAGELQSALVTSSRVHLVNMPYEVLLKIIRQRSDATNQVRQMIKNIDNNTQAVRI